MEGNQIKVSIIEKLFKTSSSGRIMLEAFGIFKPTKKNFFSLFLILLVSIIPAVIISIGENTVYCFLIAVELVLEIMLALFGIIFTGYAIFQAILNKKMLIKMLEETVGKDINEKSLLQESNETFVGLMMLTIFDIFFSFFIKLILGGINEEFSIFSVKIANEICSGILCTAYFFFAGVVIWEMKSFVFNIFQLFNAYSGARIIEIIENLKNE